LNSKNCFLPFTTSIEGISLPEKFPFPFYYEPHPLALISAQELQNHLENQTKNSTLNLTYFPEKQLLNNIFTADAEEN
jgi:hypothetical protein